MKILYASFAALASGLITAAVPTQKTDTVDGAGCAAENPATPAAHCLIVEGRLTQCRCISRIQYATLVHSWCISRAPNKIDPGCDEGYRQDLIAPARKISRFSVNITDKGEEIAADSSRLHVTPK